MFYLKQLSILVSYCEELEIQDVLNNRPKQTQVTSLKFH